MDFTLRKEHEMARALFKAFAEKEVKPLAQEVDETEEFPRETARKMAKNGFLGIPVPKEYGGQGCDPLGNGNSKEACLCHFFNGSSGENLCFIHFLSQGLYFFFCKLLEESSCHFMLFA